MAKQKKMPLSQEAVELVAGRFKLLGEPVRIQILQALHDGPLSVSDITRIIGTTQPNVSKHLKLMQDAGVIDRRQEGNVAYYSIVDKSVFEICDVVCESLKNGRARTRAVFD
jgi:ArsR family transcriptional regulator